LTIFALRLAPAAGAVLIVFMGISVYDLKTQ